MSNDCEACPPAVIQIDEITCAIYLYVPGEKVVLLQGYFELYEGLGLIRTISILDSLVCVITTKDMLKDCLDFLENIKTQIPWKNAEIPNDPELFLGYAKKGKK